VVNDSDGNNTPIAKSNLLTETASKGNQSEIKSAQKSHIDSANLRSENNEGLSNQIYAHNITEKELTNDADTQLNSIFQIFEVNKPKSNYDMLPYQLGSSSLPAAAQDIIYSIYLPNMNYLNSVNRNLDHVF
jgi:hypothetical protein